MRATTAILVILLSIAGTASAESTAALTISASDFDCVLDMQPVRGFYVDNLLEGNLADTVATAAAGQGEYPPGSVVQLVPGEIMVKQNPNSI